MLIPIKINVSLREAVALPDSVYENVENWDFFTRPMKKVS
tara:strand:- start:240 stop:359 length:120 start_codon:yes stop_codon:yes gene_type:complete